MNNVKNASDMAVDKGLCTEVAEIVDAVVSDQGRADIRPGFIEVVSLTAGHSVYGYQGSLLFVDSGTLKRRMIPSGTVVVVSTLSCNDPMDYAETPVGLFCTNGTDALLLVNGVVTPIPVKETAVVSGVEVPTYNVAPPAGRFCCWWKGALWILAFEDGQSFLYNTTGYGLGIDSRANYNRFPGNPNMLRAVDDGLYLSAGNKTMLAKWGAVAGARTLVMAQEVYSSAIPGTAVVREAEKMNVKGSGKVCYWRGSNGESDSCFMGTNQGFTNLSEDIIRMSKGQTGAAMIRNTDNKFHYIAVATA
jgi:hypothetical protein